MREKPPIHWQNIGVADAETRAIDERADRLQPLGADAIGTRELITSLECCHFNALLYVDQIVKAIHSYGSPAGPGPGRHATRFPSNVDLQRDATTILRAWCAGAPAEAIDRDLGSTPGSQLVSLLGTRTALKEWQVQRVVERIEVRWLRDTEQGSVDRYVPLLVSGTYEAHIATECPPRYLEHSEFRHATVRTLIHDTLDGEDAEISLAWAIDLLMPCHWDFLANLSTVLKAIGGDVYPDRPLELCARNIRLSPALNRLEMICRTLLAYDADEVRAGGVDTNLLREMGDSTPVGRWLAASLEKTIREQMGFRL
ncbi:MAG: hypothetical protein QF554_12250 [Dehalococcoidia bacterium]|nr:hypothetical protein [Dehalococcoidia bacterium]